MNLAHYGKSRYAVGTGDDGPLTREGVQLLKEFEQLGMILDATHLSDTSFFQALDIFHGPVLASHNNCRALVPDGRQFSDEQIRMLIERDAVIGSALDAWMLFPGWVRGQTSREVVGLEAVADHIDHVCQLAGNHRHAAIGSDLDGGFGTEQSPVGMDRISDLQDLGEILARRGYADARSTTSSTATGCGFSARTCRHELTTLARAQEPGMEVGDSGNATPRVQPAPERGSWTRSGGSRTTGASRPGS